jgi:hypothetical protein
VTPLLVGEVGQVIQDWRTARSIIAILSGGTMSEVIER